MRAERNGHPIEISVKTPEPRWRLTWTEGRKGFEKWYSDKKGAPLAAHSKREPVKLFTSERRTTFWLLNSQVYTTVERLKPDEVQALIMEQENKKKLRIARAKTVAAMADQLDRAGQRQPILREVKVDVWQRDEGKCVQCGSNRNLEFDHIIPHSLGGADTVRNLQLLCAECNGEKGASL